MKEITINTKINIEYFGMNGRNKILLIFLILICLGSYLKATSYTWTNGGGNNLWNNAANWSPNGIPNNATADNVTFDATSSANCTIDISPSVNSFNVTGAYAGVISLGSNTLSWYIGFTVTNASQFNAGTGLIKIIGGDTGDPTFYSTAPLYNVELACQNSFSWVKLNTDITITNNLTITTVSQAIWGSHTLLVAGNFTNDFAWTNGGVNIQLNGTGTQIFSSSIAIPIPLQIGKCSGVVTFNNNPPSVVVVAGYWDLNGQSVTASGGFSTTGGYIVGTGTLNGATTCTSGGLAPGNSTGCLTINGNLILSSGSNFNVDINGNTACTNYDQVVVNGTVTINGATLSGTTSTAPSGTITILDKNLSDAIAGTLFYSAPEGASVNLCGASYTISYVGGSGNDITLTWVQSFTIPEINVKDSIFNITDGNSCSTLYTSDFGSQSVCTGTIVKTYTIENLGTATLNVTSISLSGGNTADFTIGGLSLPTTIATSSSKTFTITFNPSALGLRTTTVNINNDDCDESPYDFKIQGTGVDPEINVKGNGVDISDGDITPSTIDHTDFGNVNNGSNLVRTFTIENTGSSDLTIANGAITVSGTNASLFTIGGITLPANITGPNGTATFTVTFLPTSSGLKTATIHIANNDCNEADYDYAIQGTGVCVAATITCPSNQSANANSSCVATVNYSSSSTGNPAPVITYVFTGATNGSGSGNGSGSTFSKGVTTVTLTATNECSATTCSFTVTVIDVTAPIITCASNVTINNTPGLCTGTTSLTSPTASDNCSFAGNALNFDGTDDQMLCSGSSKVSATSLGLPTTAVTVEAWIKMTGSVAFTNIAGFVQDNNAFEKGFELGISANGVYFAVSTNTTLTNYNTTPLNLNQWYHLAGTYDGSTRKLYVDGVLVQSSSLTGAIAYADSWLTVGCYKDDNEFYSFHGNVEEVRIWSVARTQSEIQANMNLELDAQTNLYGLYHFNQGIPGGNNAGLTTAFDVSGNSHDGVLSNFALSGSSSNWVVGQTMGISLTNDAPTAYPVGATTVTWTATDASGNTATCPVQVTVNDNEKPTITCPVAITVNADPGTCIATGVSLGNATGSDNCGTPTFSNNAPNSYPLGPTTVVWTATDSHSNTKTCNQIVTVKNQEINLQGNNNNIVDGSTTPSLTNFTDFDQALLIGGTVVRTFTLQNTGTITLNVTAITITGSNASDFTFNTGSLSLPTTIASSGSKTFTVTFDPSALGVLSATLHIANDDCDEGDYDFAIQGIGRDPGAALDFDGLSDRVSVNAQLLPSATANDPWTVEIMAKTTLSSQNVYFSQYDLGGPNVNNRMFLATDASGKVGNISVNDGVWHHIAFVKEGSGMNQYKTYVDGNLVIVDIYNIPVQNVNSALGYLAFSSGRFFKGQMDEVRVWNIARTCDEIRYYRNCELAGTESGLVAYYQFNQGFASGTNTGTTSLTDIAGSPQNGTLTTFALTGSTSNWVTPGGVTTGNSCTGSPAAPEANIKGNGVDISDGDTSPNAADNTDFGNVLISSSTSNTYTIENSGSATLNISSVSLTGTNAADFSVTSNPSSTVSVSGTTTFTLQFTPGGPGIRSAVMHINNDDCDEADYNISIQGTGTCIAPSFSACPSNQTVSTAVGTCAKTLSYTATAIGTPTPTITYSFSGATAGSGSGTGSGASFNKGLTTVIITATDACSNTASCAFTITVNDNELPIISCSSDVTINTTPGLCTGTTALVTPTISDNCSNLYGNALDFDGVNDYVDIGNPSINGLTTFSYECWVKFNALQNDGHIFGEAGPSNEDFEFTLGGPTYGSDNTNLLVWIGENPGTGVAKAYTTSNLMTNGIWFHVAMVFDGAASGNANRIKIYINGNIESLTFVGTVPPTIPVTSGVFLLGSRLTNQFFMNGKLDEVRLWNTARTQTQIQTAMNNELIGTESGLIRYYKLNQGTAGGNNAGLTTATATTGANGTLHNFALNGATSNWVSGSGIATNNSPSTYPIGNTTVTWTVSDASGNTASCNQIVTIIAPEINLKGNGNTISDGDVTPSPTDDTDFGNVDPSGGTTVHTFTIENTGTKNLNVSSIIKSGTNQSDFTIGTLSPASPISAGMSATFTVTFDPSGSGTRTATIAVNNDDCDEAIYDFAIQGVGCTPSIITACPSSTITLNTASSLCTAVVTYTVTASGSPSPSLNYVFTGATIGSGSGTGSGSVFNKGNTTVTVTASNGCGANATCVFTVAINDNQNPSISCPPNVTVNTTSGPPDCTYANSGTGFDPVSFSDNCPGPTVANNFNNTSSMNGAVLPYGTTTITWTVTDASSHTSTCSFNVTVHGTIYNMTQNMYFCTVDEAIAASETQNNDELMIPAGTYTGCIHVTKTINLVPNGTVILECLKMEETLSNGIMTLMDDITIQQLTLTTGKIHTNGHHLSCGSISGGSKNTYIITD